MTPAEHLAEAERLLGTIGDHGGLPTDSFYAPVIQVATLHTLIAAAAELGVPHADTTTGGGSATPQPAAS